MGERRREPISASKPITMEVLMRAVVGLAVALVLVASGSGAWAGDVQGKIQTIDAAERVIVLDDGTKLWVSEGLSMDALKEGAKVKASYDERDGKNVLTSFEVTD
jgi:hypothetical protein